MKKSMKYIIVIGFIVVFLAITIPFTLNEFVFNNKDNGDQTPPPSPPDSPTIITSNQTITTDRLLVQWTNVSNADNYSLYVNSVFNVSSETNEESVILWTNGTYHITVTALNKSGESAHSNTIAITVAIPPISLGLVHIYVNSTIYSQLYSEINIYRQDVINQGYSATIINWSATDYNLLKLNLVNAYPQGLVGAVLIGELPIANFEYSIGNGFASDFFFMDLNGFWFDTAPLIPLPNGILDVHNNSTGDLYPEIFIGRINPECLTLPNYTQAYKDYFNRNHAYRIGSLSRPHKALLYIDDSWSRWWTEYLSNFTAYSNIDCYYDNSTTTPTLYKNNLTHNYEFVHVLVHSIPTDHYWGIGNPPSEGYLNYAEIQSLNTQPLFYNLYACSACDINTNNNLGSHYLFSNNTLTVVGSTKTGGMNMYQSFYDNLSVGLSIGESFRNWFWNPTYGPYGDSYSHSLSMGMIILGDPLLTII